ncbi:MAG TPA: class I SAM-dependent methyltransferase, partial [Candidatus Limnocylindrales bacterium]|nr:class I SAM-dependent methyltransferase [Candidatus Limnocylindrales bacterium]
MDHADHVALIADGVRGAGTRWLELGCGDGAFTLALAEMLGAGGEIAAVDRDADSLRAMEGRVAARFAATRLEARRADFTDGFPDGPFDGVLAANSLHFVRDRRAVLGAVRAAGEALNRVNHLKQALVDTPAAAPALRDQVRTIEDQLKDVQVLLSGDSTMAKRNEPHPPSIASRVEQVVNGHW